MMSSTLRPLNGKLFEDTNKLLMPLLNISEYGGTVHSTRPVLDNMQDEAVYDNHQIAAVPFWYHFVVCLCLCGMGVFGISLNGFVLWSFALRRVLRTPANAVLINLTLVEFLMAFVGVPMEVLPLLQDGWGPGKEVCIVTGTVVTTSGFVSLLTLTGLSVCRMAAFNPIRGWDGKMSSFQSSVKFITFIWVYSLALALPPLFGWGRYVPELSGLGCTPDWHSLDSSQSYIGWIMIFGFAIPTTLIILTSAVTCWKILELRLSIRSDEVRRMASERDRKAFQMIMSMSIAYLLCWFPYAGLSFIHIFISRNIVGPMLSMVPTLTVKLSVCINPILYIGFNSQFHETVTDCMSCRGIHGPMNMYRNFGFQVRELRRRHKGVKDDKVSDENDEHCFEPNQEGLKDGRANVSRNEIRPTFDFEALDIAGDSFCKLRARFGKRRLQQMDDSQLENFGNCIGDHSNRLCTSRDEHSISVASDITHSAPYSTLRKWDTNNKNLKSLTNSGISNSTGTSNSKTTTSSILSSSKSTPLMTLRGRFAISPPPHQCESQLRVKYCKNMNGSKEPENVPPMAIDNTATNTVNDHIQSEMNENIETPDDNDSVVGINAFSGYHTLNGGLSKYREEKPCNQIEKGVQTEWTSFALCKDGMTRQMNGYVENRYEESSKWSRSTNQETTV